MTRTLLALCFVVLPVTAVAQLPYTHTTLVHGINDNQYRFLTPNTAGILSQAVNLRSVRTPYVYGHLGVDAQADTLRGTFEGIHVLAGLSMGGLTSRAAYFQNPGSGQISAIVTIATPHQGAPIADNATRVTAYGSSLIVDFVVTLTNILYKPKPGSVLNVVAVALIHRVAREVLHDIIYRHVNDQFGVNTQARNDVRTNSPFIARLSGMEDPLPKANVYGTIGRRNAMFRVGYSAFYRDAEFEGFVRDKNKVKSIVKACRQIAFNVIIRWEVGRICNQIDGALGSVDERWAEWTMGSEARLASATFDGYIPTSRSRYPGTSLSDPLVNFRALETNHMNIQYKPEGTNAIISGMFQVGMAPATATTPPDGGGGGGGCGTCPIRTSRSEPGNSGPRLRAERIERRSRRPQRGSHPELIVGQ